VWGDQSQYPCGYFQQLLAKREPVVHVDSPVGSGTCSLKRYVRISIARRFGVPWNNGYRRRPHNAGFPLLPVWTCAIASAPMRGLERNQRADMSAHSIGRCPARTSEDWNAAPGSLRCRDPGLPPSRGLGSNRLAIVASVLRQSGRRSCLNGPFFFNP
jgi:hypothetical protein